MIVNGNDAASGLNWCTPKEKVRKSALANGDLFSFDYTSLVVEKSKKI
jgi:hypothetical protein